VKDIVALAVAGVTLHAIAEATTNRRSITSMKLHLQHNQEQCKLDIVAVPACKDMFERSHMSLCEEEPLCSVDGEARSQPVPVSLSATPVPARTDFPSGTACAAAAATAAAATAAAAAPAANEKPTEVSYDSEGEPRGGVISSTPRREELKDTTIFTDRPPPGARSFVQWYLDVDEDEYLGSNGCMSSSFGRSEDDDHERCSPTGGDDQEIRLDEPARLVQHFMGPESEACQGKIRKLRHRRMREGQQVCERRTCPTDGKEDESGDIDGIGGNDEGPQFESVSFQLLDMPVWHNYTLSLQDSTRPPSGAFSLLRRALSGDNWRRAINACRSKSLAATPTNPTGKDAVRAFLLNAQFATRVLLVLTGFSTALVGFAVSYSSYLLLQAKIQWATSFDDTRIGFAAFLAANLALGVVAHLPVAYRPVSAGSGIAEAKAVLNGVVLPSCTELQSAACKALSVIFSGAASLPVGLEGPLIFSGLSVGTNIQRVIPKGSDSAVSFPTLQTSRAQRDFAACGTAAGATAAFYAPVGGVLFAMEEGCSFWGVNLAWQAFATSCVTVIASYFCVIAFEQHSLGRAFELESFGKFTGLPPDDTSLSMALPPLRFWFYALFAGMGVIGGIIGSIWCEASRGLAIIRAKLALTRQLKLLEVLFLVTFSSCLTWWLPQVYKECSPLDKTVAADSFFRSLGCPVGEYNQLASLLLNPPGEVALNLLFWEKPKAFSAAACLIAGVNYLIVLLLIFGSSISMGIFTPLLFVGGCFGRALGVKMDAGDATQTLSIVFSVAMLAGVTRILVSVTVIMMTATNTSYLVSCFMVATMFARVVGNWMFGRAGIYDIILELRRVPFLESTPPSAVKYRGLRARDLMSESLVALKPEHQAGYLLEVLASYPRYKDFVVVDDSTGTMIGTIASDDILVILSCVELFYSLPHANYEPKALRFEELQARRREYSQDTVGTEMARTRLQSIRDNLTDEQSQMYLDLTPYVSIAPYQFEAHGSCERAYELFRTLGLRTLVVTSAQGKPKGLIQRDDLKLLEEVNVDDHVKRRKEYNRSLAFHFDSIATS
jgi:chloride channel 7